MKNKKHPLEIALKKGGRIVAYALLALLIVTAVDIYRWPDSRGVAEVPLANIHGEAVNLHEAETPVILYFWASWCGICRHTSPQMQALQKAGYPLISIAVQSGSDAEVDAYLRQQGWDFSVINDEDGRLHAAFAIAAVPTVAIVERGKIRIATSGWTSAWGLRARYHLLRLLAAR